MEPNNCKNCSHPIDGNYCSNCGRPVKLKKIDREYIIHEIKDALFSNSGFISTTKQLLLNPGESVRHYITEDRNRLVKPVTYLIVTSLLYTVASHVLKIDYFAQFETPDETPVMNSITGWMMENMGYAGILIELYMAFWIKLFFRKSGYNLYEIFVFLCYVSGLQILFHSIALIPQKFLHSDSLTIAAIITTLYSFWAIGQFFDGKKAKNYLNAVLSFIVGILVVFIMGAIGATIEILLRQ